MMNVPDSSIAYVELYVADAVPALEYLTGAFGFTAGALAELPDRYSVSLASGSARLIVTEPRGGGPVAEWLDVHGDGVHDIALYRPDLDEVVERARQAGLPVLLDPALDPTTCTLHACVGGFGSVRHTLLGGGLGVNYPPGFEWRLLRPITEKSPPALKRIDHLAVCLPHGALEQTAATYEFVFDTRIIRSERVVVGETAMYSHVLRDRAGLTYVMAESDPDYAAGQIDQFLAAHGSAGIQHIAFLTDNIIASVREYGSRGVDFVPPPPDEYYRALTGRVADTPEVLGKLADLQQTGVLLDHDQDGELYQIFTTCPHERDTLFYELVERRGSKGFGTNNIVALFEAREADLIARSAAGNSSKSMGI